MGNEIRPDIWEYARQIVKNTIGTRSKVKGFEWSDGGGLFNKVFKVNTTDGNFILKIECDKIFFSTRKDQIENEVLGNEIFRKAGIACADILAYDFGKSNIGVRYIFTEHINNDTEDSPVFVGFDNYSEKTKSGIIRQFETAAEKMRTINNSHFGSLSPSGTLGRHETYDAYYHSTLNLLINDSVEPGIFTDEELEIVKKAAAKPLIYSKTYIPTFVHGDLGYHNAIWGNINGGENKLYIFDFGNAYFGLPYFEEHICKIHGDDADIIKIMDLDKNLYENNLIGSFERMFWKVSEQLTEDYFYCRDWMTSSIEAAKKDTSRSHITAFAEECRRIL